MEKLKLTQVDIIWYKNRKFETEQTITDFLPELIKSGVIHKPHPLPLIGHFYYIRFIDKNDYLANRLPPMAGHVVYGCPLLYIYNTYPVSFTYLIDSGKKNHTRVWFQMSLYDDTKSQKSSVYHLPTCNSIENTWLYF